MGDGMTRPPLALTALLLAPACMPTSGRLADDDDAIEPFDDDDDATPTDDDDATPEPDAVITLDGEGPPSTVELYGDDWVWCAIEYDNRGAVRFLLDAAPVEPIEPVVPHLSMSICGFRAGPFAYVPDDEWPPPPCATSAYIERLSYAHEQDVWNVWADEDCRVLLEPTDDGFVNGDIECVLVGFDDANATLQARFACLP